jgi:hypothetical protein
MPSTDDVNAAGAFYGPMDVGGTTATISRWDSETYEGRPISDGPWYHLLAGDGMTSLGMIQNDGDDFYAFRPFEVGTTLGRSTSSLNEAIRLLAKAD